MTVIQSGYPRSGNSMLYGLTRRLQEAAGKFKSYRDTVGITPYIERVRRSISTLEREASIDAVSLGASGNTWILEPHPDIHGPMIDGLLLMTVSSLIWTHDRPDDVDEWGLSVGLVARHRVYIMRDVRDVMVSWARFVTRPECIRRHHAARFAAPADVLADLDFVRQRASGWAEHVRSERDDWYTVRYEDLTSDGRPALEGLVEHLGYEVTDDVLRGLDRTRAHAAAPSHVRAGGPSRWQDELPEETLNVIMEEAGAALLGLGYEVD